MWWVSTFGCVWFFLRTVIVLGLEGRRKVGEISCFISVSSLSSVISLWNLRVGLLFSEAS